MFGHVQNFDQV